MNNEELEKKIENLLHKEIEYVVVCGSSVKNVCIEHIADALIAAGMGDVKVAEHRAARAERALKIAEDLGELCAPVEDYINQAEKELAEERKSD